MRCFTNIYWLLTVSEKIGWGSGLVGLVGFLLAVAVVYPGAHRTDIEAAQFFASAATVTLDDRLNQPEQKADLLIDSVPPFDPATDRKDGLPLVSGEKPAVPAELEQPQSLVSWLEDEITIYNLSTASASGSVVVVAPDR